MYQKHRPPTHAVHLVIFRRFGLSWMSLPGRRRVPSLTPVSCFKMPQGLGWNKHIDLIRYSPRNREEGAPEQLGSDRTNRTNTMRSISQISHLSDLIPSSHWFCTLSWSKNWSRSRCEEKDIDLEFTSLAARWLYRFWQRFFGSWIGAGQGNMKRLWPLGLQGLPVTPQTVSSQQYEVYNTLRIRGSKFVQTHLSCATRSCAAFTLPDKAHRRHRSFRKVSNQRHSNHMASTDPQSHNGKNNSYCCNLGNKFAAVNKCGISWCHHEQCSFVSLLGSLK
jgi:hypothetical protein